MSLGVLLLAATISVGACGAVEDANVDDGYNGTLVTDPPMRPANVLLTDTDGRAHSLHRLGRERVTAVFFGFTHCDDVCPTTMADLAAARRSLPESLAEQVQVVFITVDPRRDSAPVLERWLARFDPDFVGLRGPMALVHEAEDSLYSSQSSVEEPTGAGGHVASTQPSGGHDDYQVSHSALVYVFAPGDRSLVYTGGTTATEYAADFTQLLESR